MIVQIIDMIIYKTNDKTLQNNSWLLILIVYYEPVLEFLEPVPVGSQRWFLVVYRKYSARLQSARQFRFRSETHVLSYRNWLVPLYPVLWLPEFQYRLILKEDSLPAHRRTSLFHHFQWVFPFWWQQRIIDNNNQQLHQFTNNNTKSKLITHKINQIYSIFSII